MLTNIECEAELLLIPLGPWDPPYPMSSLIKPHSTAVPVTLQCPLEYGISLIPLLHILSPATGLGLPVVDSWRPWLMDGIVAGYSTTYSVPGAPHNFTFATVKLAGHMVPTYQPERAYAMFDRYLKNIAL